MSALLEFDSSLILPETLSTLHGQVHKIFVFSVVLLLVWW